MRINISKADIIWSYVAQILITGSGIIVLPAVLKLLSTEEIGLHYILISIMSIVNLFDMGFSGQFARNITYVLSGAQTLQKEGITTQFCDTVNERLLAETLYTAKRIYLYLALIAFVPLVTFGTYYIYSITDGFHSIDNVLLIWLLFCLSCLLNLYYIYLNAFLQGRGLIKDARKAQVYSRAIYILLAFVLLLLGAGLISIVIANLISPFAYRIYAKNKFYDKYIKGVVARNSVSREEFKHIFHIIFFNAKKMGVISVLATAIGYASTLVIAAYLPMEDVSSYGLMMQLVGIITTMSTTMFNSMTPQFSSLLSQGEIVELKSKFGLSIFVFLCIQVLGFVGLLSCPAIFGIFRFNAQLPCYTVLIFYFIYKTFEFIQSLYSQLLLAGNDMVFYHSSVATGIITFIGLFIVLHLGFGLYGVVGIQSLVLYSYVAWKWPLYTTRKYGINTKNDILINPYQKASLLVKNTIRKKIEV